MKLGLISIATRKAFPRHSSLHARSSVQNVARGGITAFFIYGTGIALTYFSQLVIARLAGVEAYGTYAYVVAWVIVLAYVATLGFEVGLLRFIPRYEANEQWSYLRGIIRYAEECALFLGLALALSGAAVISYTVQVPDIRKTFLIGLALVPVLALLRVRCAVIRALGGVTAAIAPDRLVREGLVIAAVGVFSLGLGWQIDGSMVMGVMLASTLTGLTVATIAVRWYSPPAVRAALPEYDATAWRNAALPLVILGAAEALMNRTGVILLGSFGTITNAGIYSLGFNIALVVTLPRIAVNMLFAPAISGLYARDDKAAVQLLANKASSWTLRAGGGLAIVLFVLADFLLGWFGPRYTEGAMALRILLLGQAITASAGSQLYLMTMTGHERAAAVLLVACALANAAASCLLISAYGLVGAAIATAATLVLWNASMAIFLWRKLSLRPGFVELWQRSARDTCGNSITAKR